jgi:hypothetical protein
MGRFARTVIGIYVCSLIASLAAFAIGARAVAGYLALPGLLLSGLAFLGHLVTLDEDAAGGWSNPNNSRAIWRSSLAQLGVKFLAFLLVLVPVLALS